MQSTYPIRSYIRFKAKSQLLSELWGTDELSTSTAVHPAHANPSLQASDALQSALTPEGTNHLDQAAAIAPFDDDLFQVVATTVLHPCRNPDVYEPCASADQVNAITERVSQEIITAYQTLHQPTQSDVVEQLNQLL